MKKTFILLFCLIMCFLSACTPENAETTRETAEDSENNGNSIKENDMNEENTNPTDGPIWIDFISIDFLQEALVAADGTEEEYNAFKSQANSFFSKNHWATQNRMRSLKEKLLISGFPVPKDLTVVEDFRLKYYVESDEFYALYIVGDIMYFFEYCYDTSKTFEPWDTDVIVENYQIASYEVDLYGNNQRDDWYHGRIDLGNSQLCIRIQARGNQLVGAKELFEIQIPKSPTPTE